MFKKLIYTAALLTIWAFPAHLLFGTEGSLSISPAVVMLRGTRGQSTTRRMTIRNGTTQTFAFEMKTQDVVVKDGKRTFVDAGTLPGSIAATATYSQKVVTVAPGENAGVDVTVTIPANVSGRAIVALFHGITPVRSHGTVITASLGMLLTFALSDDFHAEASPLVVKAPTLTSNLTMVQRLVNSGGDPVVAKGVMAIVNQSGSLVARQSLPSHRLLPGETTDVEAQYGGDLPAGHYRALVTYEVEKGSVSSSAEFDVR